MTTRLLCTQVPQFWEYIKYALSQVERFGSDDESLGAYNRVFASLLNDKSQCLLMQTEERGLKALMITEILEDMISAKRTLNIRCLYAYIPVSNEEWKSDFEVLVGMAKNAKCSKITFQTSNARVEGIAKMLGFNQHSINMEMEV